MVKSTRIRMTILHWLHSSPNPPELIIQGALAAPVHTKPKWALNLHLAHSTGTAGSIPKQSWARELCPQQQAIPQVIPFYWKSWIHLQPKNSLEKKSLFFEERIKTNKKESATVLQKNSLSYWECDQNRFPIKTWEDPLTSAITRTLDSAQSLVLGRAKLKWWAKGRGRGECHSIRIP